VRRVCPGPALAVKMLGMGRDAALAAATRCYLRGEPLDMSKLAAELGIGRATLYRWVGNREQLLATVLAEATEREFRRARRHAAGQGVALVIDVMERFMRSVIAAPPLRALTEREPLLFIRLATTPAAIEHRSAALLGALIAEEAAAGRLNPALPPPVLAEAIVRLSDSHLYAHLLGGTGPEIEIALRLAALLLGARP
jgi:AcrR family transcriptional regulator